MLITEASLKRSLKKACRLTNITQWHSRPHTPKDNSVLERFNRTIQEEFIEMEEIEAYYTEEFKEKLGKWLIEYNLRRPHKSLDYISSLQHLDNYYQGVLPMYSSLTQKK